MTIGEKVKLCRVEKDISQKELATRIGVDVSFICKVEKNEKNISLDKLILISKELIIGIDELKIVFYTNKISELLQEEDIELKKNILNNIINND